MRNDYWLYFDLNRSNWCDYLVDYATENYPNDAVTRFENAKQDESLQKEIRWQSKQEKAVVDEIWHYANPNK